MVKAGLHGKGDNQGGEKKRLANQGASGGFKNRFSLTPVFFMRDALSCVS